MMNIVTELNVCLLPLAALIIMFIDAKRSFHYSLSCKYFCVALLFYSGLLVSGVLVRIILEYSEISNTIYTYTAIVLFLLFTEVFCVCWLMYISAKSIDDNIDISFVKASTKRRVAVSLIPGAALCFLTLMSPLSGMIFTLGNDGAFERGQLYFLHISVCALYFLAGIIIAANGLIKAVTRENKREYLIIILSSLFPAASVFVAKPGAILWYFWPWTVISILLIYLLVQNGRINTDPLTGLLNRDYFERYLRLAAKERCRRCCLIIIGIDDLKSINDSFGHTAGDEVLCTVADLLRRVFHKEKAVIARYGGDEFAILSGHVLPEEADFAVNRIRTEVKNVNMSAVKPYNISLSAGCAMIAETTDKTVEALAMEADDNMYREKQSKKQPSDMHG